MAAFPFSQPSVFSFLPADLVPAQGRRWGTGIRGAPQTLGLDVCFINSWPVLGFSLGAPRSSVASGAGLEPGAPRGMALAQDLRNGHLEVPSGYPCWHRPGGPVYLPASDGRLFPGAERARPA